MKNAIEQEYRRNRSRIQHYIKRYEKLGYDFSNIGLGKIPEKITLKDVEKLKKLTPKKLRQKAGIIDNRAKNEEEYRKNRRRIQNFIKSNEKRGYDFSSIELGKTPEKITRKDVEKLKKLTPEKLYKKATVNEGTNVSKADKGKYLKKGKNPKKGKNQKKGFQDSTSIVPDDVETVLRGVEQEIASFTPKALWYDSGKRSGKGKSLVDAKIDDKNRVNNILNGAISQLGRLQVAKNLASHAGEANTLIQEILYGSGDKEGNFKDGRTLVNFDITRFAAICYGRALTVDESIAITEAAEENEY